MPIVDEYIPDRAGRRVVADIADASRTAADGASLAGRPSPRAALGAGGLTATCLRRRAYSLTQRQRRDERGAMKGTATAAMSRYTGRHALITGGARGLGFAAAARLAAEGAAIGLLDKDASAVEAAASRLRDDGRAARAFAADVTSPAEVRRAFDEFEADTGRIDILVNMAGIYPWIEFEDLTLEAWREITAVNLDATFVATHDVLPRMKKHGYGRITTVSSGTSYLGVPEYAAYVAAKAGIIGYTRVLAREGGPHGITANTIMPGLIATEHVLGMREDIDEVFAEIVAQQFVPRRGQPDDIAAAIAYACSEEAGFLTGQVLNVGGVAAYVKPTPPPGMVTEKDPAATLFDSGINDLRCRDGAPLCRHRGRDRPARRVR